MNGIAAITVSPMPGLFSVTETNGGHYCAGGAGIDIGLSGSQDAAVDDVELGLIADRG